MALLLTMTVVLLSGCYGSTSGPVPASSPIAEVDPWLDDLNTLVNDLPKQHRNAFFHRSKDDFMKDAEALKREFPGMNEQEKTAGMMKLVASLGDAHTWLNMRDSGLLPLLFYDFSEGMFATRASPEYAGLLGKRLAAVNGHPVEEVLKRLSSVISYENEAWLKIKYSEVLMNADLLYGLKLTDKKEEAVFTLEDPDTGKREERTIKAVHPSPSEPFNTDGPKRPEGQDKLSSHHPGKEYWFEYLPESGLVYVQYNACRDMKEQSVKAFGEEVTAFLKQNKVNKLVVDMRWNGGGNSSLFEPFMEDVAENHDINRKGKLYVLIGAQTFSSGLLNANSFKVKTNAILVGEPTGGKPNGYGDIKFAELPHSKLSYSYSTKYFKIVDDYNQPSLMPDVAIEMTFQDWWNGRDPVMDYVTRQP